MRHGVRLLGRVVQSAHAEGPIDSRTARWLASSAGRSHLPQHTRTPTTKVRRPTGGFRRGHRDKCLPRRLRLLRRLRGPDNVARDRSQAGHRCATETTRPAVGGTRVAVRRWSSLAPLRWKALADSHQERSSSARHVGYRARPRCASRRWGERARHPTFCDSGTWAKGCRRFAPSAGQCKLSETGGLGTSLLKGARMRTRQRKHTS